MASNQNAIFKISLNPTNYEAPTNITGGNIGLFINGVARLITAMAYHGKTALMP
ncbi:MAG: hypothetical protein IPN94_11550 [Sphingobacteriales bacterium]|nr:hypothetical protein [Sphingobacteriales bacterium]